MTVSSIAEFDAEPTVVSVSDVHGHRDRFESALLTFSDHPDFPPMVERVGEGPGRDSGGLRWVGGEAYVLVVNGDAVDRGPDSARCLDLVRRLQSAAPDGHVRYLLGNHELYLVYPSPPDWDRWYTAGVDDDLRRTVWDRAAAGDLTVGFEGHEYTYVYAGAPDGVDPVALNEGFADAATVLRDRVGDGDELEAFERIVGEHCPSVYRFGGDDAAIREDPEAGVVWLDFSFLPADAPPQVVGHTPQKSVTRLGNVVCQDVIVENVDSSGGETLLVETTDDLRALVRQPDGGITVRSV